jgi:hypothetical protein
MEKYAVLVNFVLSGISVFGILLSTYAAVRMLGSLSKFVDFMRNELARNAKGIDSDTESEQLLEEIERKLDALIAEKAAQPFKPEVLQVNDTAFEEAVKAEEKAEEKPLSDKHEPPPKKIFTSKSGESGDIDEYMQKLIVEKTVVTQYLDELDKNGLQNLIHQLTRRKYQLYPEKWRSEEGAQAPADFTNRAWGVFKPSYYHPVEDGISLRGQFRYPSKSPSARMDDKSQFLGSYAQLRQDPYLCELMDEKVTPEFSAQWTAAHPHKKVDLEASKAPAADWEPPSVAPGVLESVATVGSEVVVTPSIIVDPTLLPKAGTDPTDAPKEEAPWRPSDPSHADTDPAPGPAITDPASLVPPPLVSAPTSHDDHHEDHHDDGDGGDGDGD